MFEHYYAFLVFVMIMTGTPGPGNLSLMAIGQTEGFRAAVPFLCGVAIGFICLTGVVGLGLGSVINASQVAGGALRVAGGIYILYLAFKVLRLRVAAPGEGRKFTFTEGLMLHPLSPKSWGMLVASAGQFLAPGEDFPLQAAVFVLTYFVCMLSAHSLWCLAGASMLRAMGSDAAKTAVTACMAALMVGATAYALFV